MTHDHEPRRAALRDGAELLLDVTFGEAGLVGLRSAVAAHAGPTGLTAEQADALVFMAYELATNAVRHGGGRGRLRLWHGDGMVCCQVTDDGPGLPEGMATPVRPGVAAADGRGLWLVEQFADTLTITSGENGVDVVAGLAVHA